MRSVAAHLARLGETPVSDLCWRLTCSSGLVGCTTRNCFVRSEGLRCVTMMLLFDLVEGMDGLLLEAEDSDSSETFTKRRKPERKWSRGAPSIVCLSMRAIRSARDTSL